MRQKSLTENCDTPRLVHTFLLIPKEFRNTEEFPMKLFGIVIQKKSTEKRDIPARFHKKNSLPELF